MAGDGKVEVIERETVYDGYCRVERLRLRHRLFAGGMSAEIDREVVRRGHAVAVLPYDPVRDEVVLIEQFRIGAHLRGDEPWLVETVAGLVEDGEESEAVARREAREEAGVELGELVPVASYYASPGTMTEYIDVYCGRVDAGGAGGVHGLADEGEDIRVIALPFAEALATMKEGRIESGHTLIALQWLALNHNDLRQRWIARTASSADGIRKVNPAKS